MPPPGRSCRSGLGALEPILESPVYIGFDRQVGGQDRGVGVGYFAHQLRRLPVLIEKNATDDEQNADPDPNIGQNVASSAQGSTARARERKRRRPLRVGKSCERLLTSQLQAVSGPCLEFGGAAVKVTRYFF